MYIAIAGNIGSGKSTLTKMLARHYHWEPRFEVVDRNPYLEDYYNDIRRWSFALEVFFLKERFRDLIAIQQADHTVIQDRTIFEGVYVFLQNNRDMGNISQRDYDTYMELFNQMMQLVRLPDLMIYLRATVPHLVGNIQQRGREYEQSIKLDYLDNLNRRYEQFIYENYKGRVMIIDKDQLDFEHRPQDFAQVVDRIDQTLFGLFSE
jgi:deoxyadenosine/deoxycytidine kinase